MTVKVRVAAIEAKAGPFVFRETEMDEPRSDEVLVRVVACGICHTDAHVRNQGYQTPLPIVLGHEGAGVVEKVGADVERVKPGERVAMSFPSCGRCDHCLGGHPAYCVHNLRLCFGASACIYRSEPGVGSPLRLATSRWAKSTDDALGSLER